MKEKEVNVNELLNVINELEAEMWYYIHADSPHRAHKVKTWVDALKKQLPQTIKTEIEC